MAPPRGKDNFPHEPQEDDLRTARPAHDAAIPPLFRTLGALSHLLLGNLSFVLRPGASEAVPKIRIIPRPF